jgi:hypothetical protein
VYLASDIDNDRHFLTWVRQGKTGDYNELRLRLARESTDPRASTLAGTAEKSWLYVLGRNLVCGWLPNGSCLPERHRFPDGSEILFSRRAIATMIDEVPPNDERIEQLLASFESMRTVVVQGGGTLSVVLIPSAEEVFGVPDSVWPTPLVSRLMARLQTAGFSVLDLRPAIRSAGETRSPYFRLDHHFNEYGNRVVAEAFASWFRRTFPETPRLRPAAE